MDLTATSQDLLFEELTRQDTQPDETFASQNKSTNDTNANIEILGDLDLAQIDPMLAIYLEELSELTAAYDQTTQALLEKPDNSAAFANAERQLHTIKGGARMTGLTAIGDLAYAGESLLDLIVRGKVGVNQELLATLRAVSEKLCEMSKLAEKTTDIEAAESLIEDLNHLSAGDSLTVANESNNSAKQVEAKVEAEYDVEITDLESNKEDNPGNKKTKECDQSIDPFSSSIFMADDTDINNTNSEEPNTEKTDSKKNTETSTETIPASENIEDSKPVDTIVTIYLEELAELVEDFDTTTQRILENPDDIDAIRDAERQLHTIKGGARMAGLLAIGDLSHAGESLLNLVGDGKIAADQQLPDKLLTVSDELFRMYELAVNGAEIEPAVKLVDELHRLAGETATSTSESAVTTDSQKPLEPANTTGENAHAISTHWGNAPAQESTPPVLDIDDIQPETTKQTAVLDPMLAIYLEELSELVIAFEQTTQRLINNIDDTEAMSDAERQLHTIKGGARMTGLQEIADLSHAGESLLNQVVNNKISVEESLLAKIQLLSDTLSNMYDTANAGQTIHAEPDLIAQLNSLSGQPFATGSDTTENESSDKNSEITDFEKKNTSEHQANVSSSIKEPSAITKPSATTESAVATKPSTTESLTTTVPPTITPSDQVDTSITAGSSVNIKPAATSLIPDFKMAERGSSELEHALADIADKIKQADKDFLLTIVSPIAGKSEKDIAYTSSIRVPISLINQLITSSNEWGHKNIRLIEQYEESGRVISELKRTADRLKEQIRNLELETDSLIHAGGSAVALPKLKGEFDPLEMDEYTGLQQNSRSLAESLDDLMNLTESLELGLKNAEKTSASQELACRSVQEDLISTRMTKITGLLTRLKRIVRQVSSELGIDVALEIADENCEMDRTILERITASLEHLIRNSLAHGIEKPDDRVRAGKPQQGKITLKIDRVGPEIVIILEDDGAGINVEKLRAISVKKGLIDADAQMTDKEIFQLILMSGMSTAEQVSQVSGRGVGMDVVNAEINALGGTISIDSKPGKFTRFTLSVPYNLATNQVMFLDVAGEVLAVPVAKLEGMQRLSAEEINHSHKQANPTLESNGHTYHLRYLCGVLGLNRRNKNRDVKTSMPVILLEENGQRVAYIVNEIRGNREVMLKPLGILFEESRLLSSATILGSGEIILLLNTHELISLAINGKTIGANRTEVVRGKKKKLIMVVDDSITVRKITGNLLLSSGYSVVSANDGINALEVLKDETPDLILLDIEMPRMDGFELLENIRDNKRWKQVPVIMISSRSGEKHRQHANKLGANGFIGKPWEAKQLAAEINRCLNNIKVEAVA